MAAFEEEVDPADEASGTVVMEAVARYIRDANSELIYEPLPIAWEKLVARLGDKAGRES